MTTPHPAELDTAYGVTPAAPITRLRFYVPGTTVAPVVVVPTRGSLTWDMMRWPRTTLTAELPTTITPTTLPPALTAYGGRVQVTLGGSYRVRERTFTAATLAVTRVRIDRPDARVVVEAASLEAVVNEDRYDVDTDTARGSVSEIVSGIVRRTLGASWPVVDNLGALDVTLPSAAYTLEGDVWPTVERIMSDAGGSAWFDAAGRLVLDPEPVVKASPDLIVAGGARGALTGYESARTWGPNRVVLVYRTPRSDARRRYTWDAAAGTAPTTGRVAVNNADPEQATILTVHRTDAGGDVATAALLAGATTDDRVSLVYEEGDTRWSVAYTLTGPVTINAGSVTVPVTIRRERGTKPATGKAVDLYVWIRGRRVIGRWQDTNPSSATRVGGPYGRNTWREDRNVDRGNLPTQAEADAAALAQARLVVGRLRTLTVEGLPAPWLIPGDTIQVGMLGGLTERHVVAAVTHDLTGLEAMSIRTRDSAYTAGPF